MNANTTVKLHQKSKLGEHEQNFTLLIESTDVISGKYQILKHLGVPSGQADIYLCEYNGEQYIAKIYRSSIVFDMSVIKSLKEVKSKLIVPLIEDGVFKDRRYEVYPYFKKGDLSRVDKLDEDTLRTYVIPFINDALRDIHRYDIAHMDLKPSNIFIDKKDNLYLADFGISSVLEDASIKITKSKGTLGYRPPESYSEISIKSKQFDYYSFGMTIIHLWLGESPYLGLSEMQIMAHTMDGKIPIPDDLPQDVRELVVGLTAYDKRNRIGYDIVKKWCAGESIAKSIAIEVKRIERTRGSRDQTYELLGLAIHGPDSFAEIVTESIDHWNEAKERLDKGLIDPMFNHFGDDAYASYVRSKAYECSDTALALLVLMTDSSERIGWKDSLMNSVSDIGNLLVADLPEINNVVQQMFDTGFLKAMFEYLQRPKATELVEGHDLIKLAFHLSDKTPFNYKKNVVHTFVGLIEQLGSQSGDVLLEMETLMQDHYFLTWVEALKAENGTSID